MREIAVAQASFSGGEDVGSVGTEGIGSKSPVGSVGASVWSAGTPSSILSVKPPVSSPKRDSKPATFEH